jgi:iron complex outermembrane recepter protein
MRFKIQIRFVVGSAAAITLLATTAYADSAATADEGAPQGLEEIVVNARRVEENLQDVPITVTAITAQTLTQMQVIGGTDLIKVVPNLSVQQMATGTGANYSLRGINDGVIAYFNEVPAKTEATDDQLWDLNSVQALAGPQGTLFGKNGTGGAILFVPQRPTDKFEGYLDASYGNYDYEQVNTVVNLPVNDMLQIRLGYRLLKHDPFVTNIGGGPGMQSEDRNAARLSILFDPTSNVSNYTVLDYSHRGESPPPQITSHVQPGTGCITGLGCLYPPANLALIQEEGAQQNALGIRTIDQDFPSFDHATNYGLSNIFTAELGHGLTFKYIFGYRYLEFHDLSSKTGFTLPLELGLGAVYGEKTWTNEVQLLDKMFDDRFTWTLGGFFSQDKTPTLSDYELFAPAGASFYGGEDTAQYSVTKTDSTAFYLQGSYAITNKLNFTAGVRHTRDQDSQFLTSMGPEFTFIGPELCHLVPGAVGVDYANCSSNLSATFSAVTYNFSLDYHITDGVMVYATTRKGYNGGGFNTDAPNPAVATPGSPTASYGPEYLTDFEVGTKTEGTLAGIPVRADVATFLANYTDIQRTGYSFINSELYSGTINGPKARIYGLQLQTVARLFSDLTVSVNYGFLHTEFEQGAPAFPKGSVFAQAPEQTLSASTTYSHGLPAGGALVGTISYTYQSGETFQDDNVGVPYANQPGFSLVDARVGWQSMLNSPVDVTLFVKNLTNKAYALDREDETQIGLGFVGTVYSDPRTYGLELRYRFGT